MSDAYSSWGLSIVLYAFDFTVVHRLFEVYFQHF